MIGNWILNSLYLKTLLSITIANLNFLLKKKKIVKIFIIHLYKIINGKFRRVKNKNVFFNCPRYLVIQCNLFHFFEWSNIIKLTMSEFYYHRLFSFLHLYQKNYNKNPLSIMRSWINNFDLLSWNYQRWVVVLKLLLLIKKKFFSDFNLERKKKKYSCCK